ncbi:MAG: hypothetical protein JJ992_09875, partial [Planctomycetes bacterium]|nr:hypothetical protein [Planctomycetota bacterium]
MAGHARPVLSILALSLCAQMVLHSAPAAAACGGVTPVADGGELDNAIAAFNAETTNNCVFTISVDNDIPVFFPLPIVSNSTAGASLIIEGNGYKVDSQNRPNQRVFNIATDTTVILNELTVTGGNMTGGGVDNRGGGILSRGNLTLQESSVNGNASQNFGGGIATVGGTLTIRQSTIANNTSGRGGGIHSEGNSGITIENSTISGNDVADEDIGAGIRLDGGVLALDSATIVENFPGG